MNMKWNLVLIVFMMISLSCSSDDSIEKKDLYQTWWKGELIYDNGISYNVTFFFEDEKQGEAKVAPKKDPLDIEKESFTYYIKDKILNIKINKTGIIGGNWLIRTMNDKKFILERKTGSYHSSILYLSRDE